MKITRKRKSKKGRIEIIPMIDVMFFLLATFILASLSMQHFSGVPVNLTKGKADLVQVENQITLTINAQGLIFLNKEQLNLDQLKPRLQTMLNGEDKAIIIMSDQNALQGVVMRTMIAARDAGAKHFSMVTRN